MNWNNSYLSWNETNYGNISFIVVDPKNIWHPDIELYNAASLPEIYKFDDRTAGIPILVPATKIYFALKKVMFSNYQPNNY